MRGLKNGEARVHPLSGREIIVGAGDPRPPCAAPQDPRRPHVFVTERGAPMTRNAFFKLLAKAAVAGLMTAPRHITMVFALRMVLTWAAA